MIFLTFSRSLRSFSRSCLTLICSALIFLRRSIRSRKSQSSCSSCFQKIICLIYLTIFFTFLRSSKWRLIIICRSQRSFSTFFLFISSMSRAGPFLNLLKIIPKIEVSDFYFIEFSKTFGILKEEAFELLRLNLGV